MTEIEFQAWPKTPRLNKPVVFTEKIDGTNGAIHVTEDLEVGAQSRNKLITPQSDNYGFAGWVQEHAEDLASMLGPGIHYGEWWGHGIQRGYGLPKGDRRFSLFNVNRYGGLTDIGIGLGVVPQLNVGTPSGGFDHAKVVLEILLEAGSMAAPGYMNPEGIIAYHTACRQVYKFFPEDIL